MIPTPARFASFAAPTLVIAVTCLCAIPALSGPVDGTILYIGDSHSYGNFGKTIDAEMRQLAKNVVSEASCGSSPSTWTMLPSQVGNPPYEPTVCGYWEKTNGSDLHTAKKHDTPKIEEEVKLYHPAVTVIELGTNIAAHKNPLTEQKPTEEMMRSIQAAGSQCVWIGPPSARENNSDYVTDEKLDITENMIETAAKTYDCFYVSSRKLTTYPPGNAGDGIHYPPALATQWGQKVNAVIAPKIRAELANPSGAPR